ncbi:MAG: hypothetical protein II875_03730 [Clostridia bacterium]|nr:hypothetical protein [Clostridia bacterium]
MKKILSLFTVLLLIMTGICIESSAGADLGGKTLGTDVPFEDITDFYQHRAPFGEPPVVCNYFYHEEITKSAKKGKGTQRESE